MDYSSVTDIIGLSSFV